MRFQGDNWAKFFYSPSWIIFPMIPSFSRKKTFKSKIQVKTFILPPTVTDSNHSRKRVTVTGSRHTQQLTQVSEESINSPDLARHAWLRGGGWFHRPKTCGWFDTPWKINGWNLQPSPFFRKENDLNQTFMRTCSMLIFRGVHKRTYFLLVVSVGWGYLILGVDMPREHQKLVV